MDLLRVHSQDLHEHIAQEVGECLESGAYTDLAVRCAQGQTLHAHKVVMAAVSPYLQMVRICFYIFKREKKLIFIFQNSSIFNILVFLDCRYIVSVLYILYITYMFYYFVLPTYIF